MNVTHMRLIDHHGTFSKKRMHLQPMLPIPINYATAAIPRFAPFGTEYTPDHTIKIVGGRRISIPNSIAPVSNYPAQFSIENIDPAIAPTKTIQNIRANDSSQWQQQSRTRFDTTYRTEFINRSRHPEYTPWYQQPLPDQSTKVNRVTRSQINQYSVLPPIGVKTPNNNTRNTGSARSTVKDIQQPNKDQEVPIKETIPKDIPPLNLNNAQQNIFDQQQQPMMNNEDIYLPEEPILLTDYEEERLFEQIRSQLGNSTTVDKLKLFYQELTAYDPNITSYIHYSNIQLVASQLGLNLQEDTFRFAMCKFVSPDQPRGFVNYEDMVRYFGKCLSSINPNQYGQQRILSPKNNGHDTQKQNQIQMRFNDNVGNNDDFDPDERQVRVLLKQNLKYFNMNGTIDFDKLYRELKLADKNQSGVLNRQQIEEVIYKVRLPFQRTLIYHILEKHCRAYSSLYRWEAFIQYLKEQVLDLKQVQDRSSPLYKQNIPNRNQWLDQIRREYNEKDRLRIINRYIAFNEGPRVESNHPTAWFTRFLRLANAMYGHRTSTNREQDFVLPREEARRLFRAYNHVWDLKIDDDRLQRVLDACGRNGNIGIDDALKLFAKQT